MPLFSYFSYPFLDFYCRKGVFLLHRKLKNQSAGSLFVSAFSFSDLIFAINDSKLQLLPHSQGCYKHFLLTFRKANYKLLGLLNLGSIFCNSVDFLGKSTYQY